MTHVKLGVAFKKLTPLLLYISPFSVPLMKRFFESRDFLWISPGATVDNLEGNVY